jgi:hypothetical protein
MVVDSKMLPCALAVVLLSAACCSARYRRASRNERTVPGAIPNPGSYEGSRRISSLLR